MSQKVKKREVAAPNRLCKTDRESLIRCMKKDGCVSYEVLAEQFGISPTRVSQIAKESGMPARAMRKLTDKQVKEIRKRYHADNEPSTSILNDFPWVTPGTIKSAAVGHTYGHVPMPKKLRPPRNVIAVARGEMELINLALVFATGLFTLDDVAAFFDIPLGTVQSQFHYLRKKGFYVPQFGKSRKGIPDFDQFDIYELLCFSKKHRHSMRRGRASRETKGKKK